MTKNLFHAFVDIHGGSTKRTFHGLIDVVHSDDTKIILTNGNKELDINDKEQYRPQPVKGVINDSKNNNNIPVSNTRITFIKDFVVDNKNNQDYEGKKTIIDRAITNSNGEYIVFVPPGQYTIKVDNDKYTKYFKNQKVKEGLINQFYYLVDSTIKEKNKDVIKFHNTDKNLIQGVMLNEHNNPISNAEIIITKNDIVITYIKTDSNGKYKFALEKGVYDIRIRQNKKDIKILNDFNFDPNNGFVESLKEQFYQIQRGDLVWICK
jgi:hypothetical protein